VALGVELVVVHADDLATAVHNVGLAAGEQAEVLLDAHQVAQLVALIDREREADVAALGAFVVANANDGDTPLLEARKLEVK